MLRHIGMTRRQIGAMLASEGLLSAALGLGAGLIPGWLISLILVHVINRQSFHWSMELYIPWEVLGGLALALLLSATLTAALSGRRAMGTDVVRAVREDW
jgi:putative ABC transport system permease protein